MVTTKVIAEYKATGAGGYMLLEQYKGTGGFRITTIKKHSTLEKAAQAFLDAIPEKKRAFYMGVIEDATKKPLFRVELTPKKTKGSLTPPKRPQKGKTNGKSKSASA